MNRLEDGFKNAFSVFFFNKRTVRRWQGKWVWCVSSMDRGVGGWRCGNSLLLSVLKIREAKKPRSSI